MLPRPHSKLRALLCAATFAGLIGCAGLDTYLPEISAPDLAAETQRQESEALRKIESNGEALLNIGWPVLMANADLCPKVKPSIGLSTHSLETYSKRLQSGAGRVLGADDTSRVFHIAKGGPADLAGVKRGDIIVDSAGEIMRLGSDAWKDTLSRNEISVRRGSETLDLEIKPIDACAYNLRLSSSTAINAFADGRNITVTGGMIDFIESDDELALIIGHELAHNTMGHVGKAIGNYILSLGGTRYTRPFESEADYVGLYYLVRAGYSADGVENLWERLARVAPKSINRAKTHPTYPDRYLRIRATTEEISAKQSTNAPLFPNFKSGPNPSKSE